MTENVPAVVGVQVNEAATEPGQPGGSPLNMYEMGPVPPRTLTETARAVPKVTEVAETETWTEGTGLTLSWTCPIADLPKESATETVMLNRPATEGVQVRRL